MFSSLLGLLSSAASFCCRCHQLLVVVVDGGGGGVLSLLSEAPSQRSLKILVYINLTMYAITMEPQHQAQNGTYAILGVWWLNLVWPSTQTKIKYPFVIKFQLVIGTNREVFERFLVLLSSQQVPGLINWCTFALTKGLDGSSIPATE